MSNQTDSEWISFLLSIHSAPQSDEAESILPCEDERVVCATEDALLIAVLDGCGGTGGKHYPQAENWTGARLASHLAGHALYDWFSALDIGILKQKEPEITAGMLKKLLAETLIDYNTLLKKSTSSPSLIRSSMNKDLPTTLAALLAFPISEKEVFIQSFWAGNSRNYVLIPAGMEQLSLDDVVGSYDPFDDLRMDGILNNTLNASEDFKIRTAVLRRSMPCIILSVSDGIFGYLDSPIRLEWILLDTLQNSKTPFEWETELRQAFGEYSGDDHTLQLAALGFRNFAELKSLYVGRRKTLEKQWIQPLEKGDLQKDPEKAKTLWLSYKKDYLKMEKEQNKNDEQ